MKNVKSDTKYIIKRILIGVGITLILFNLKKCSVYALNSSDYYFYSTNSTTLNFSTSKPCTSSSNSCYHLVDSLKYDNSNINFYYYNTNNRYHNGFMYLFQYNNKYYIFATYYNATSYDYSNIAYLKMSINDTTLRYPPNLIAYASNNDRIGNFATSDSLNSPAPYYPFQHRFYEVDFDNVSINDLAESSYSYADKILSTGELLATNTNIPTYYGNRLLNQQDPLTNYTKVDLTGYQAILLVPKNYPYLLSEYGFESEETNANNPQIHYNIFYEKCVKPTLIELNNFKNFSINTTLNSDPTSEYELNSYCSDTPKLYTQNYPIYNLRAEQQPSYYYMGILVYNNSTDYSQNTPNWINNQQNPFGQSFVYVEEEFYNYYLVENFSTFNQSLSYKDFNLEDQTTNINSLPTFNGLVDGSLSSIDTLPGQNMNFQYFLDFVKFPFNFLKSFITGTCEPITLPLPHLGNMQLPCMSTIYSQFIPSSLINLLSIVINGLLFWRFTLSNIHSLQDVLQPEDTELEVWSL